MSAPRSQDFSRSFGGGSTSRSLSANQEALRQFRNYSGVSGNSPSRQRDLSGGSFSSGRLSGGGGNTAANDALRQLRTDRGPTRGDMKRAVAGGTPGSGNSGTTNRGPARNNAELQQLFRQYREQQAGGGAGRAFDPNTTTRSSGRSWLGNEIDNPAGNRAALPQGQFSDRGPNRDRTRANLDSGGDGQRWTTGYGSKGAGSTGDSSKQSLDDQLRRWRDGQGGVAGQGNPRTIGSVGDRNPNAIDRPSFDGRPNVGRPGGARPDGSGSATDRRAGPGDQGSSRWTVNRPSGSKQFGRGDGPRGGGRPGDNQFGSGSPRSSNRPDGPSRGERGEFGAWSKHDRGQWNDKTSRWYGNSGFGDHRERGDFHKGDFNRRDWGNQVRHDWNDRWWGKTGRHDWNWYRGRNWRDVPFCGGWWGGNRFWGNHWYWNGWRSNPWYWWAPCTAPVLTTWVDFGWNYPCYWDYGPNEYITYYNNAVYVDGQRYASELEYYAQVRNLARSAPALSPAELANIEWLPLGVFAVTRPGQQQAGELVQLAVSKDGLLSGTLLNQQTGQTRPLQGTVEQATQRAAWTFADSSTDALVVETSLYNLTEAQCSALAHLDAASTEVWQLVRLQQPQVPGGPTAASAPAVSVPAAKPVVSPPGAVPPQGILPPQGPVSSPAVLPPQGPMQ